MSDTNQSLTIAVCGATGLQGGAVLQALRNYDIGVKLVALTRDPQKPQAVQLSNQGVEVRQADFDDATLLENALRGCDSVFAVTNFWEHFSAEKEYQQARAIFDAAEKVGVKHVVWSTLENTRNYQDKIPIQGDYKVAHFDEKGRANEYALTKSFQLTSLYTSFYYENLTGMMKLTPDENKVRTLCVPMDDKPLPIVAVQDIGKMAAHCLVNKVTGEVGVASQHLTGQQMAEALKKATGEAFQYTSVPADTYRTFGFPGCQELGNMFQFKNVHNEDFCQRRNVKKVSQVFGPKLFEEWCVESKDQLI
jgi:uncharacterized protein YbjT (DUF2867 family)